MTTHNVYNFNVNVSINVMQLQRKPKPTEKTGCQRSVYVPIYMA